MLISSQLPQFAFVIDDQIARITPNTIRAVLFEVIPNRASGLVLLCSRCHLRFVVHHMAAFIIDYEFESFLISTHQWAVASDAWSECIRGWNVNGYLAVY